MSIMSITLKMITIACMTLIIVNVGSAAYRSSSRDQTGAEESRGHHAFRRLDCQVFCKKTGFSGYVGGCQCGFTLFANKRSDDNNGNIGFHSSPDSNQIYGNKYKSNIGLSGSTPNELNNVLSDDHYRSDSTYPSIRRLSNGRM